MLKDILLALVYQRIPNPSCLLYEASFSPELTQHCLILHYYVTRHGQSLDFQEKLICQTQVILILAMIHARNFTLMTIPTVPVMDPTVAGFE